MMILGQCSIELNYHTNYLMVNNNKSQKTGGFHMEALGSIFTSWTTAPLKPGVDRKPLAFSRYSTARPVIAPSRRPYTVSWGHSVLESHWKGEGTYHKFWAYVHLELCIFSACSNLYLSVSIPFAEGQWS